MHKNRPRLKIPLESFDIILELITLSTLLILWICVFAHYASLPEIIPTHFNLQGEIDGTGGKDSIWLLMTITTIIAIGMYVLTKYPHVHNYLVEITEENAAHNYKISCRLLRIVNLITLAIMAYVVFTIFRSSFGKDAFLGTTFTYIIIIFSVVMPIILVIYLIKNQKASTSKK